MLNLLNYVLEMLESKKLIEVLKFSLSLMNLGTFRYRYLDVLNFYRNILILLQIKFVSIINE